MALLTVALTTARVGLDERRKILEMIKERMA
jgi:hypothetical protein